MTKAELLFREFQREEAISYAKFRASGWEVEDYLEYINICEQIRALYKKFKCSSRSGT